MITYDDEEEASEGGIKGREGRARRTDSKTISTENESENLIFSFWLPPSSVSLFAVLGCVFGERIIQTCLNSLRADGTPLASPWDLFSSTVALSRRLACVLQVPGGSHLHHQCPWPRADVIGWQLISGNRGPPVPS